MSKQQVAMIATQDEEEARASVVDYTERPPEGADSSSDGQDSPEALVRKDNKAVSVARFVIIAVLVLSAVATSCFVYMFTRDSEREAFKSEFDGGAKVQYKRLQIPRENQ